MFKSYDGLELKKSETEGRYIIATRDIDVGENLLKCKAYFSMPCEIYKKITCGNCVKIIKRPQQEKKKKVKEYKCNVCNEIWYCSEFCKKESQPIHAHYECKFFKKIKAPKLSEWEIDPDTFTEVRMMVGVISRFYQERVLNKKFNLSNYLKEQQEKRLLNQEELSSEDTLDDIFDLVENTIDDGSNKAAKELIDIITDYIANLFNLVITSSDNHDLPTPELKKEAVEKVISVIRELIHKVRCNQFGIWTKNDKCIAVAISPSSSFFNHSCIPNCINIRDGNKMTFKALYPVKKGEPLAISYLDLDLPVESRKEYLKYGYYFDCGCPRCDEKTNQDECMDNWISKFYCQRKKCVGLYYSKTKVNIDQVNKNDKITLNCSDCNNEFIINSTYFNNSPFPLTK
ncbi:hypothetical protein DICPUDRAFT_33308 [Dictyostelium purpureum]|uniref:SET domain-containing protein n=1 Tax=Dictyostelium purpureum TaxID=5786 RepID=F0ZKL8_DICPU|nr:uncharacterized protein DICPUDRAFT_33308 [Dictyostelium purpureum]EGC35483.1 hypothetical protein DICPUDRAFT_33308 [Dictyostelium purpureum]|eukprot:XP_003287962.1 hypothetical protein DICPUDRAFT_33308 [Dictyostelium purpureum]